MAMEEENKVQQDKLLEVSVATDLQRVNKLMKIITESSAFCAGS